MYSQHPYQSQRYPMNPPPPHQAQPHFYGAPDMNLGLHHQPQGLKPGARGYYCSIDSLNVCGVGPFKQVDSLVISGYEGGFDVFGISKNGLDKISSIENLRGGIFGAKILPWTIQSETLLGSPLIAVVVHGPVLHSRLSDPEDTLQGFSDIASVQQGDSPRGSPKDFSPSRQPGGNADGITHFQTTVEVYSLGSKKHMGTLLCLPTIPFSLAMNSHAPPPLPAGALSITADAGNIIVTSGLSGEVWIYRHANLDKESPFVVRCIGKVWTSIHHVTPKDSSLPAEFGDNRGHFSDTQKLNQQHMIPLLSLKGRWLAYSPSRATSQVSLRATVPSQISAGRAPGLAAQAPPQLPTVNCAVDMLEDEQPLKRVAREVGQKTYDAAKWASDKSLEMFKNYWNKSPANGQTNSTGNGAQPWYSPPQAQPETVHTFPPTHGETLPQTAANMEPSLISIMDLDKLASYRPTSSSSLPHPMSTFRAPLGCSFISFAPSGLALFTASSDGKCQYVWDLMRIQYTKSSVIQAPHLASLQGQHVRQVAVFTRMSPCTILDVVWTMPYGERIAVITGNNTSHFMNMPSSAFAWPPLRRRIKSTQPKGLESSETTVPRPLAARAWSLAQPLMPRGSGMGGSARTGYSASAVTAQGGRALASGISRSFGAASETFDRFRNQGENKLHGSGAVIRSAKWTRAQDKDALSCLLDGMSHVMVNTYRIKQRKSKSKGGKYHLYVGSKPLSYTLPPIPDQKISSAAQRVLDMEDDVDLVEKEDEGVVWVLESTSAVKADLTTGTESSIPQAEIESNAPYQPFHTDRRVALHVYSTQPQLTSSPSVSTLLNPVAAVVQEPQLPSLSIPWVFGGPVNAIKLDVGPSGLEDDDFASAEDHRALPSSAMERVTTRVPEVDEDVEQIVVTTRRRKGAARNNANSQGLDDDGFFEDDCEVLDFASQRV